MLKKKIFSLFLVLSLILSTLTGCSYKEPDEITLESIAKINNCETDDLNIVYDDEGNITFIDALLSDSSVIEDGEDAYAFIKERLATLLNIEDVNIELFSAYTSPNTNIKYYRFQQTLNGDFYNETDVALEYIVNGIKLGVDEDGHPVVVNSDLDRNETEFDVSSLLNVDEAEALLLEEVPDLNIYKEQTGICIWNDSSSKVKGNNFSYKALAYMVYADNSHYEEGNGETRYLAYIVRAKKMETESPIITVLAADELGEYSQVVANTSLKFFDDKKDVGTYTYTTDFEWMVQSQMEYATDSLGTDHIEVTVPVMYCETDGLYYLGEAEHYITMSNFYDADSSQGLLTKINPYVSKDPSDLNSWHFKYATNEHLNEDEDTITYFDDPDYVLSSFAKYYETVEAFGDRFEMFEEYPTDSYLLTTYYYVTDTYPTDENNFVLNAANGGQLFDWSFFLTSPCYSGCLDTTIMAHEFSHGVNSHFTDNRYANQQGAQMEGYADAVGYLMASVLENKDFGWYVGGTYYPAHRSMSDPNSFGYAQYIDGTYYVPYLPEGLVEDEYLDFGGVHFNSSVSNFLCYQLVEGEVNEDEESLTMEEDLNLWFETLYLSNYSTEFINQGAYLKYAVRKLGYSDAKVNFVNRIVKELGFDGGQVDKSLLSAGDTEDFTVNFTFEGVNRDDYNIGYRLSNYNNDNAIRYFEGNSDTFMSPNGVTYDIVVLRFADLDGESAYTDGFAEISQGEGNSLTFHVKKIETSEDNPYTFADEEVLSYYPGEGDYPKTVDPENGNRQIYITKTNDLGPNEYNVYLIDISTSEK